MKKEKGKSWLCQERKGEGQDVGTLAIYGTH